MTKVYFITGSNKGLGLAIAKVVLDAGHSLVATARNPKALESLVTEYGADRVLALKLDVTDYEEAVQAAKEAKAKFGRIDVLVNNAGYAESAAIEDMSVQSYNDQMNTNLNGTVYVTKAILPIMREQKSGRILQVSSIGGRVGSTPGLAAYQAAKFAVAGFSTVLASEVKPFNIKVTVLEPGGMKTDWNATSMEGPAVSEPYKQTVEAFAEMRTKISEDWLVPEFHAKAILKVSEAEDPPMRLLLGKETPAYAKMAADSMKADDEKWLKTTIFEDV